MNVLSLCDFTGKMVEPWVESGHTATCVDIQHPPGVKKDRGITWVGADVRYYEPAEHFDIAFAFPPCTDLSVSGARWFRSKGLEALAEAIAVFGACVSLVERIGNGFAENPVSTISTYYRKPDYTFDPYEYGDPWTKKTCLWAFGPFVMPHRTPVEPMMEGYIHRMPPGPDRAMKRSETPAGFARAVFEANA